jgi:GAF domain-containing protein
MVSRLKSQPDLSLALETAVRDIVALHGAEFGNLQLAADDGSLWIVAHQGLDGTFMDAFARVDPVEGTACARSWRDRVTVFLHDVSTDKDFQPFIAIARQAGFRAVISSPLVSSDDEVVGIISAHFAHPKVPTEIEIRALEAYCRELTDNLLDRVNVDELARKVPALQERMLERSRPAG